MTLPLSEKSPQEAWAPFLYTAKVRHSQDGGTTTRRYLLRDVVPIEPIQVSFAELRPVVRFKRPFRSHVPFSRAIDEVYSYADRLYRPFTFQDGASIPPSAAFAIDTPVALEWERWMIAMVPDAPWKYSELEGFPLLRASTMDEQVKAGRWTHWRTIESDHAREWAETHARYRGSVLIGGGAVFIETSAPTWYAAPSCPIYHPTRPWNMSQRSFHLDAKNDVSVFFGLGTGVEAGADGVLELCDLPAADFDRTAVEIAMEALKFSVEVGKQTSSQERALVGVKEPYERLRLMHRRREAPSRLEVEGIFSDMERLHEALSPAYRSKRYFLPRATRFVTETRLRFAIEVDKASQLSNDDRAALFGL